MTEKVIKFSPNHGAPWFSGSGLGTTAEQYRAANPACVWNFNPWTGERRLSAIVNQDPYGYLMVPPYADVKASPKPQPKPEREKALTHDEGKPPLAHLPWAAIDEMALVQQAGKDKYGDFYNYRKGMEVGRNLSCAIRHIRDFMNGEEKDHESGRHPLGHALCRIAFVLQNIHDGVAIDDRYKLPTNQGSAQ